MERLQGVIEGVGLLARDQELERKIIAIKLNESMEQESSEGDFTPDEAEEYD